MPNFRLFLQCELTNIISVAPKPNRSWGMKIECSKCHEKGDNFIYVDENETEETTGGGSANHVSGCKFCKNQVTINVVPKSVGAYTGGAPAGIITFDFRGAEPYQLELDDDWVAIAAESEATFEDGVDLSQDWCDYDEKGSQEVMITNPSVTFERVK